MFKIPFKVANKTVQVNKLLYIYTYNACMASLNLYFYYNTKM